MNFTPNIFKRFMIAGLSAALVVSAIVPMASADTLTAAQFTDVPSQYQNAVDFVVKNNFANGISATKFGIADGITRGDAAIIVARASGIIDSDAPASGFTDVPARGQLAIDSLKSAGIVIGKSAAKFDFHNKITRGEAALLLSKALGLEGKKESLPFTDVVGTRYEEAVSALVANEVTNGITATQFGTFNNIKRGDFARFLYSLEEVKSIDDTEAPVLNYVGSKNLVINKGTELTWPAVTAIDNSDDKVEVNLVITDEAGKEIAVENFNSSIAGTYQFIYSAVDEAENVSAEIIVMLKITELLPPKEFTFLELNTPYISWDNEMTITMENLEVVDKGDFYEIQFTYTEQNNTSDKAIDQGAFKIYYKDGQSQPQYGFFNKLYPDEKETRTYTFKTLKLQEVIAIEYGADLFFKQTPTEDTLKWNVEFPS